MDNGSAPSLVQHASLQLRRDILEGVMPPLHKLKVEVLSETYGISGTPVREVLNRLTHEGLVKLESRKGFHVAPMSLADLEDIIRLRLLVESDALAESIRHGGKPWEVAVADAHEKLEKTALTIGDGPTITTEEWADVHKAFHMATLSACPSVRQLEICNALYDQAERYRRLSARKCAIPRARAHEHRTLFRAIVGRDLETALTLLRNHLESTRESIGKTISLDIE